MNGSDTAGSINMSGDHPEKNWEYNMISIQQTPDTFPESNGNGTLDHDLYTE